MECNCEFSFHSIYWYKNLYLCKVTSISKPVPRSGIKSIIGDHIKGRTNNDVKVFRVFNQPLGRFPRNLHKIFPNLTHLVIQRCGIKKISQEDLIGLENLEHFSLFGNNLTTLPDDLFVNMKKLRRIFFGQNPIEHLSSNIFEPIKNILEYANFENEYINQHFDKNDKTKNNLKVIKFCISSGLSALSVEPIHETEKKVEFQFERNELMRQKFVEFKASEHFVDFTIKVRGKDFKVHKNILAAQSSVFEEIFTSDGAEAAKTFPSIKNFSETTFASFVDYFYSGELSDEVCAMQMFELATVFDVPALVTLCTDRMLGNLQESNALEAFNFGHQHKSDELKLLAFKVIQKMYPDLKDSFLHELEKVNSFVSLRREMDKLLK